MAEPTTPKVQPNTAVIVDTAPVNAAPASRPSGRTLAEFKLLSIAEQKLLDACCNGEIAKIADELPKEETLDNTLRASFVRFLLLGGDAAAPMHEHGVQLHGAWINSPLDLESATLAVPLNLWNCRIEKIDACDVRLSGLHLNGSRLEKGLDADRMQCAGGVFLGRGFYASGEVRLAGAAIGGNFDCRGGRFEKPAGQALILVSDPKLSLVISIGCA